MFEHRDRTPPEEPEDALDRWRRIRAESEEPEPRERKLDIVPPTLAEIDQRIGERIAAEHQFMCDIIAHVVADLQDEWVVGAMGPPGPSGPRGEQGPVGKLPLVKQWKSETAHYARDVVAYDGGTFQAKRDTGQPPSHPDWLCLATAGRDGKSAARSARLQNIVVSTWWLATAAASSRSRMRRVPARVPVGSSLPARASAALPERRGSEASAGRQD
jgi:hypothetical protein